MPNISDTDVVLDDHPESTTFRLSDYIKQAANPEPVLNADGSTTLYVRLHRKDRYSTLPRPRRRRSGRAAANPAGSDHLTGAANVRRVRRRPSALT